MKKLFICIFTFVTVIFISSFVFAEQNIVSDQQIDPVQQIVVTEYYGYLSLIIDAHLEIGRWEIDDKSMFFAVWVLNEIKHYADLDIIEYLWYSFDMTKTFDSLLYDIKNVLDRTDISIDYIKKSLLSFKDKKSSCDSLKEITDKNFSLALSDLDTINMQVNLRKSLENDKCASDSRIYYNAQSKILEELKFYYKILDHKYNYFYGNNSP